MISYHAIVLAAGVGKRMKVGQNKQFLPLGNKPLINHTLDAFDQDSWCASIVLVVSKHDKNKMEKLMHSFPPSKPITMVEGGAERQESVFCGLQAMRGLKEDSIVFIHDGARPFVTIENLHDLAEAAKFKKAGLLAVPVTDTIKQLNGKQLTTLDRNTLWAAQTPQGFHYGLIYQAHRQAIENGYKGTDDASLVEQMEHDVAIAKGSYDNIKLTTPEDLNRAKAFLKGK